MDRARLIIKQVQITKQGEISFFQLRLPQNVKRIIGIETDALIISPYSLPELNPVEINTTPFLKFDSQTNPTLGKLKLQSQNRMGIFFESWIPFVFLQSAMDMSYGLLQKNPYLLHSYARPKRTELSCTHRFVEGMFEDELGKRLLRDINYILKVFVWVETNEENKGVRFDFQQKDFSQTELQIKI